MTSMNEKYDLDWRSPSSTVDKEKVSTCRRMQIAFLVSLLLCSRVEVIGRYLYVVHCHLRALSCSLQWDPRLSFASKFARNAPRFRRQSLYFPVSIPDSGPALLSFEYFVRDEAERIDISCGIAIEIWVAFCDAWRQDSLKFLLSSSFPLSLHITFSPFEACSDSIEYYSEYLY